MLRRASDEQVSWTVRLLLTEDEECQCDRGLPYLEVIVPV